MQVKNFTDKIYVVPKEHHAAVKEYHRAYENYLDKANEKAEKFKKEMAELENEMLEIQKHLWMGLAAVVGIDAAKSWQNELYALQTQFIDHGFAAFIHREFEKTDEQKEVEAEIPNIHPSMIN